MKILDYIPDNRIKSCNVNVVMTYKEYIDIAKDVIDQNEFQRKKVISSAIKKTLKEDVKQKCTIPPIVLGIKAEKLPGGFDYKTYNDDETLIRLINQKEVIILDGLQRTYVLLELFAEDPKGDWINQSLRCEVYIGLDKLGVLYRMLTLNTGQTTMSTRHLLEILYFDYLDINLGGFKLILDKTDEKVKDPLREFKFKEVIEGYNSFLEGKEVPIERPDILSNIETLSNLAKTDDQKEGFKSFLILYHNLLMKFTQLYSAFKFNPEIAKLEEYRISSSPFGETSIDIFARSQSLTGLGSALNFLKRNRNISFDNVNDDINKLNIKTGDDLYFLLKHFDYIRNNSKKVGNDQRFYFKIFYQTLFDPKKEKDYNIKLACDEAYQSVMERIEG
jgi:hypothetical protein